MEHELGNSLADTGNASASGAFVDQDASDYVIDLLSELQMIAKVSGLSSLSEDIQTLLSRHGNAS